MPRLGALEIGLIVLVVLIVFGAGNLPQFFGALGKGIRECRRGKSWEEELSKPKEAKEITASGEEAK